MLMMFQIFLENDRRLGVQAQTKPSIKPVRAFNVSDRVEVAATILNGPRASLYIQSGAEI